MPTRAAFTVRVDGTDQSYVDLDDPLRLEFDYVQRIGDLIDVLGDHRQCRCGWSTSVEAALTLPRYVAASRPRSSQIVFEPDTELTAFVRPAPPAARSAVGSGSARTADRAGVAGLPTAGSSDHRRRLRRRFQALLS